jgi:chemotaxis protein CheD
MVIGPESGHFLFPSTLFAHRSPHHVQTVLGSCISVCLFDDQLKYGGINHYMMPWWNGKNLPSPKYGDIAIERLIEKMIALGTVKQNLVAKIFGGANQLAFRNRFDIGEQNTTIARDLLKKHGIVITGENVGGDRGRKIVFNTQTGQVFMKILDSIDQRL